MEAEDETVKQAGPGFGAQDSGCGQKLANTGQHLVLSKLSNVKVKV